MGYKPLKKITVKAVVGSISLQKLMKDVGEKDLTGPMIPLLEVIGIARDFKIVSGDKGESVKFLGQFKATNLETGEIFVSGACFLPAAIPDLLFGAIGPKRDREVQFGFRVGAHFDASAITKYVYDVESLMDMAETDPLAMLENSMSQGTAPQLTLIEEPSSAPEPAAAPEPVAAPEPAKGKKSA